MGRPTTEPEVEDERSAVPQAHAAEEYVAGAIMLSRGSVMSKLAPILKADAFHDVTYRDIYRAALSLWKRQVPADYATMSRELQSIKSNVSLLRLSEISLAEPTAVFSTHYAGIINEMDIRRRLIQAHQSGAELAWNTSVDLKMVASRSEALVAAALRAATSGDRTRSLESEAETYAQEIMAGKSVSMVGSSTPWRAMNRITLGLVRQNVYLLAARTQVGKSIIVEQLAIHYAQNHGPVYMASLEMGQRKLLQRGTAMVTGLPRKRLLLNDLAPWEREEAAAASRAIGALPIKTWTGPATVEDITSAALRYQSDVGRLSLVLIDYIQLMGCDEQHGNREQDVAHVSRSVKALSERLNVPVFAAAQVSRAATQRKDPVPELSDLRESGSLEQDADYVLAVHRDDPQSEKPEYPGQALLVCLKDRDTGNAGIRSRLAWNVAGELYTDVDSQGRSHRSDTTTSTDEA